MLLPTDVLSFKLPAEQSEQGRALGNGPSVLVAGPRTVGSHRLAATASMSLPASGPSCTVPAAVFPPKSLPRSASLLPRTTTKANHRQPPPQLHARPPVDQVTRLAPAPLRAGEQYNRRGAGPQRAAGAASGAAGTHGLRAHAGDHALHHKRGGQCVLCQESPTSGTGWQQRAIALMCSWETHGAHHRHHRRRQAGSSPSSTRPGRQRPRRLRRGGQQGRAVGMSVTYYLRVACLRAMLAPPQPAGGPAGALRATHGRGRPRPGCR